MPTAYVVGFMHVENGEGTLRSISITSEDPWHMTRYWDSTTVVVLMSPELRARSFDTAQRMAKEFAEASYPDLERLFAWRRKR